MRELVVKLESLKDSQERKSIIDGLKNSVKDQCDKLLNGLDAGEQEGFTEGDLLRHDIKFIKKLQESLKKVKDSECREALISDLDKSILWRENRLLGKTNEYKLDEFEMNDKDYGTEDLYRSENWWIECLDNLPNKVINIENQKEQAELDMERAQIQENLDALSTLESEGL